MPPRVSLRSDLGQGSLAFRLRHPEDMRPIDCRERLCYYPRMEPTTSAPVSLYRIRPNAPASVRIRFTDASNAASAPGPVATTRGSLRQLRQIFGETSCRYRSRMGALLIRPTGEAPTYRSLPQYRCGTAAFLPRTLAKVLELRCTGRGLQL